MAAGLGGGQEAPLWFMLNLAPHGDRIAVVDRYNHRVQLFNSTGGYVSEFGPEEGGGEGQFRYPAGIAWSPNGSRIAVADTNNHRAQLFNATGGYVDEFGKQGSDYGQFRYPAAAAWSPGSDRIAVVDYNNHRVQLFTATGGYVGKLGGGPSWGTADGEFWHPAAAAWSPHGDRIVVTDYDGHRAQLFNATGGYVGKFGGGLPGGGGEGQLRYPAGVTWSSLLSAP